MPANPPLANVVQGINRPEQAGPRIKYKTGSLPRSRDVDCHFQGGGYAWRGHWGLFMGRGRSTEDCALVHTYTANGGLDWEGPFRESNSATGASDPLKLPYQKVFDVHANTVIDNRMFILVKGYDHADISDPDAPPTSDYQLWSKVIRRYDVRYVQVASALARAEQIDFFWPEHGLKGDYGPNSDKVHVTKFEVEEPLPTPSNPNPPDPGASWNGFTQGQLAAAGPRPVHVLNRNQFRVRIPGAVMTGSNSTNMIVGVEFIPTTWAESRYPNSTPGQPSVTWEQWAKDAVNDSTTPPVPPLENINICQGFWRSPVTGKWYTPLSGDLKAILQIPNPIDGPQSDFALLAKMPRCTKPGVSKTTNYLTEPTMGLVAGAGTAGKDAIFGFLRPQSKPYEAAKLPEFYFSLDGGQTLSQSAIKAPIASRCPIPCALGDDGYIYGFCMERQTDHTGDPEFRPAYLLRAPKDNALATGADKCGQAFTIYEIGEVYCASQSEDLGPVHGRSSEASNTGLPTVIKDGSWIIFIYEEAEDGAWQTSEGDTKVDISWCNLKYFAVDTRPSPQGEYPLPVRGVL